MGQKVLMKGNEALAEAAIRAGCKFFAGYPITPQNEVPAYMAEHLPRSGGVFIQAESELAAINMVYGAAGAGARAMTSSSSPGISLKQEGISYIAGSELPCVIANIVRCGPGLGGILASQGDYFQATKGGGHGDYRLVVLAPASVQEMADLTMEAFDIADQYRNPVMILGDGIIGQMMEPVEFKEYSPRKLPPKTWATTGARGRRPNVINSLNIVPEELEKHNIKLQQKYRLMSENEIKYQESNVEDAELILVAYGTCARVAKSAMDRCRAEGMKVGLIRPISLFPFPRDPIERAARNPATKAFLVVEMSAGQMIEDVMLSVLGRKPIHFLNRMGGMVPTPKEVYEKIQALLRDPEGVNSNE